MAQKWLHHARLLSTAFYAPHAATSAPGKSLIAAVPARTLQRLLYGLHTNSSTYNYFPVFSQPPPLPSFCQQPPSHPSRPASSLGTQSILVDSIACSCTESNRPVSCTPSSASNLKSLRRNSFSTSTVSFHTLPPSISDIVTLHASSHGRLLLLRACRSLVSDTSLEAALALPSPLSPEALNPADCRGDHPRPQLVLPAQGISQSSNGSTKPRAYALGVDVRNHHGVYFSGYRLPGPADEARFLQSWERALEGVPSQKGFLYQELAQQQPWEHALREGEGRHPFDFVEYSIFDSMEDLTKAAEKDRWRQGREALREFQPREGEASGFYEVAISVARDEPKESELVAFTLFEVRDRQTANFLAAVSWPKRVELQSSQPGFLSAILHQMDCEDGKYLVFNRNEWANREAFLDAEKLMEDTFPIVCEERRDSVLFYPGLFKVVRRRHGS